MKSYFEIPQITFTKNDFKKESNEIVINLNNYLWLNNFIEEYLHSHRRIFPQIDVQSPSGNICNFAYPRFEGADIVMESKRCNLRLTFGN